MKQINKKLIIGFILSLSSLYALQADSVEVPKNPNLINDGNRTQVQQAYPNQKILPYQVLKSGEPSSGKLIIANSTNQAKTSTIKLYFVLKNHWESNNLIEPLGSYIVASYNVPPFRKNTYRFENGPSMKVKKDTFVYLIADNNITKMIVKEFLILK